jgi:DNA-directed RNA polymerase specialized sigma24 family protein
MRRADRTLDSLLAQLATKAYVEKLTATFVKRFHELPRETIRESIQQSFYKVLRYYAGSAKCPRTLEEAERVLHTVLRNTLIDEWRKTDGLTFIKLDDDYLVLERAVAQAGGLDEDEGDAAVGDDGRREDAEMDARLGRSPDQGAIGRREMLETTLVEEIDTRNLIERILSDLDPKYGRICVQLLQDWSPGEIGGEFRQNGYRLRVWARVKICKILGKLAELGHELAERLQVEGGCAAILRSAGSNPAPC